MRNHVKLLSLALFVLLSFILTACGGSSTKDDAKKADDKMTLKVGVTSGPHAELMEVVKQVAAKDGLELTIIEFSDFIQPNIALDQGDIDVNSYQHKPFLDGQVKDRGYKIESVAKTLIFPLGMYSKKIHAASEIKDGDIITIPNDPTNGGRALMLLEKAGLLKLKPDLGDKATILDIAENPKNLVIKELEAPQLPLSLPDVTASIINVTYAMQAGLVPTKDAIILEDGSSPYANILVARTADKDKPAIQKLIKAYHSNEVKKFAQEHFQGSCVPTW